MLHVLRDCPASRELRATLLPHSKLGRFLTTPFYDWFKENALDYNSIGLSLSKNWETLFLASTWLIWKARNEAIFDHTYFHSQAVLCSAYIYAMDLQVSMDRLL